MDIGTAKVGPAERARVPHHGLDLVDPDARFTAADYRRYALGALAGHRVPRAGCRHGRWHGPVPAGGRRAGSRWARSGMTPSCVRSWRPGCEREGLPSLLAELDALAPTGPQRVDRANHRRVIRAIERARVVGDAPPPAPEGYPAPVVWLGLMVEPVAHAAAIEARARAQFARRPAGRGSGAPGSIRRGSRPVRRDGLPGGIRCRWPGAGPWSPRSAGPSSVPAATPADSGPGSARSPTSTGCAGRASSGDGRHRSVLGT